MDTFVINIITSPTTKHKRIKPINGAPSIIAQIEEIVSKIAKKPIIAIINNDITMLLFLILWIFNQLQLP